MATAQTYHCLCTTLILATIHKLESLPVRAEPALDQAKILPVNTEHAIFHNVDQETKPVVIRRGDGFEKRILLRCKRCNLVIGYKLDEAQFGDGDIPTESIVYILPGALMSTDEMKDGKMPATPGWAQLKT